MSVFDLHRRLSLLWKPCDRCKPRIALGVSVELEVIFEVEN
jgi:hypothetical protein